MYFNLPILGTVKEYLGKTTNSFFRQPEARSSSCEKWHMMVTWLLQVAQGVLEEDYRLWACIC